MSTMREHLTKFHGEMARHHSAAASHFSDLSKCVQKAALPVKDATSVLDALSAEHAAVAEYHNTAAEACEKSAIDELAKADQIIPSRISGVTPDRSTVTPVPRHGQPSPAAAGMHPAFAKLVEPVDLEESMQSLAK